MVVDIAGWQGFFTYVGLVAGGLTGLIFVALSLQITAVRARPAYVVRARATLGALTGMLVLCGLVLIPGQTTFGLGVESLILFLALIADVLRTVRSFEEAGHPLRGAVLIRTTLALVLLSIGGIGSLGLLAGVDWALFAIGLSTLLGLPLRLYQAWALLVAALPLQQDRPDRSPADAAHPGSK